MRRNGFDVPADTASAHLQAPAGGVGRVGKNRVGLVTPIIAGPVVGLVGLGFVEAEQQRVVVALGARVPAIPGRGRRGESFRRAGCGCRGLGQQRPHDRGSRRRCAVARDRSAYGTPCFVVDQLGEEVQEGVVAAIVDQCGGCATGHDGRPAAPRRCADRLPPHDPFTGDVGDGRGHRAGTDDCADAVEEVAVPAHVAGDGRRARRIQYGNRRRQPEGGRGDEPTPTGCVDDRDLPAEATPVQGVGQRFGKFGDLTVVDPCGHTDAGAPQQMQCGGGVGRRGRRVLTSCRNSLHSATGSRGRRHPVVPPGRGCRTAYRAPRRTIRSGRPPPIPVCRGPRDNGTGCPGR